MEKLDGDLTQLLFEIIPQTIAKKYNFSNNYVDVFNWKIPKTFNSKANISYVPNYLYNFLDEEYRNIFEHKLDEYIQLNGNKEYYTFKFDNYEHRYIESTKKYMETIDKYTNDLRNSIKELRKINNVEYDKYTQFCELIIKEILIVLPVIVKAIFKLKIKLLEHKYNYSDNKTDNYGFKLVSNEDSGAYFVYDGKKYQLKFIDWTSGLFEIKEYSNFKISDLINIEKKKILNEWNNFPQYYSKYGQYDLKQINVELINSKINMSKYGFDNNQIKLLSYKLDLEYRNTQFDLFEQLQEHVK